MVLNIPSSGEGILVVQSNPESFVHITVNVSLNCSAWIQEEHDTWKEIRSFPSGDKQILHPMVTSVTVTSKINYHP